MAACTAKEPSNRAQGTHDLIQDAVGDEDLVVEVKGSQAKEVKGLLNNPEEKRELQLLIDLVKEENFVKYGKKSAELVLSEQLEKTMGLVEKPQFRIDHPLIVLYAQALVAGIDLNFLEEGLSPKKFFTANDFFEEAVGKAVSGGELKENTEDAEVKKWLQQLEGRGNVNKAYAPVKGDCLKTPIQEVN